MYFEEEVLSRTCLEAIRDDPTLPTGTVCDVDSLTWPGNSNQPCPLCHREAVEEVEVLVKPDYDHTSYSGVLFDANIFSRGVLSFKI